MDTKRKAKQLHKYLPADMPYMPVENLQAIIEAYPPLYTMLYKRGLALALQDLETARIFRRYTKRLLAKAEKQRSETGEISRGTMIKLVKAGLITWDEYSTGFLL